MDNVSTDIAEMNKPLVKVNRLKKYFAIPGKGLLHAVDDVNFEIFKGQTLGLVGESGCGKTTVGNVMMGLIPKTEGEFIYRDRNVFSVNKSERLDYCRKIQIIFQDPFSSLNPRKTIESILQESYVIHKFGSKTEIIKAVHELCDQVEIPKTSLSRYPHELDGGMRQVVGIARALSLSADFIICDEPVSSLDVSVQARIINLLMDLQKKLNLSYLFISHDLSVVRHISHRIAVMYLGQIVETSEVETLFKEPMHPYTIALLSAVPRVDISKKVSRIILKGDVPSPLNPKNCCRFSPRCWMVEDICRNTAPRLAEIAPGHFVSCHFANSPKMQNKILEKLRFT